MDKHSGYTLESLSQCVQVFESLVKSMNNSSLKAVYKKFKTGKYFEVARLASQVVGGERGERGTSSSKTSTKPSSAAGGTANMSQLSGSHVVNQS